VVSFDRFGNGDASFVLWDFGMAGVGKTLIYLVFIPFAFRRFKAGSGRAFTLRWAHEAYDLEAAWYICHGPLIGWGYDVQVGYR
jgi:hypothetical protein